MRVKNIGEVKDNKEACLYKRYGEGVHLIKSKKNRGYNLLIICLPSNPALFISETNEISYTPSIEEQIEWKGFDEDYTYIKKLSSQELIVDCSEGE